MYFSSPISTLALFLFYHIHIFTITTIPVVNALPIDFDTTIDTTGTDLCARHDPSSPPRVVSEALDPHYLDRYVAPLPQLPGGAYSGETPAHNPHAHSNTTTIRSLISRPWKAASLESPARLRGNGTKWYYRDEVLNVESYPWNTIGRLFFSRFEGDRGGWCTGTLVGKDLVLTASHCFPWGFGRERWMRFVPGYANGTEPYGGSFVSRCRGVKNSLNVTGTDYVVCQLCSPLGNDVGWMGTQWWSRDQVYQLRTWKSTGYPVDSYQGNSLMLLENLTISAVYPDDGFGKELGSKVFASPGWSGGPLWEYTNGVPKIVGICSGGQRECSRTTKGCHGMDAIDDYHDVSAGGQLMSELVSYATKHWSR